MKSREITFSLWGDDRISRLNSGFTLVELLTVVSIMALLFGFVATGINGLMTAQNVTQAAGGMSETLDQAREYAMANHTYVFVGFQEVDASQSVNAVPQASGTGRIVEAIAASKDGTNNYANTNLMAISKLNFYIGVHLADFSNIPAPSGPMSERIPMPSDGSGSLAHSTSQNTDALFTWPFTNPAKYTFKQAIQFDPEGVATLQQADLPGSPQWLEIGLQQTHGSAQPALPSTLSSGGLAAIQVDGVTGATHVYRP